MHCEQIHKFALTLHISTWIWSDSSKFTHVMHAPKTSNILQPQTIFPVTNIIYLNIIFDIHYYQVDKKSSNSFYSFF